MRTRNSVKSVIGLGIGLVVTLCASSRGQCVEAWHGGTSANHFVRAFAEFRGELVLGGFFTEVNGEPVEKIARWDGINVSTVGEGVSGLGVHALLIYQDSLYVGGSFSMAGGVAVNNIARWNGSKWSPVGTGTSGTVWALGTYEGALIAGGDFTSAGGAPASGIARWDGATWQPVGGGVSAGGSVRAIREFGGSMIVGGIFSSASRVMARNIAEWNGVEWSALGSGTDGRVDSLIEWNGQLVVGGNFYNSGGLNTTGIAAWTGQAWQSLNEFAGCTGARGNGESFSLEVFEGGLVRGTDSGIMRFDGTCWEWLGEPVHNTIALKTYHGELHAGGASDFRNTWARRGPAGPLMVVQPESRVAAAGGSVTLRALAIGNDTLMYQWRRGGKDLTDGAGVFGSTTPELTLQPVSNASQGSYDCVDQNGCGEAVSASVLVRVVSTISGPVGPAIEVEGAAGE